jgi:hypothetical protein
MSVRETRREQNTRQGHDFPVMLSRAFMAGEKSYGRGKKRKQNSGLQLPEIRQAAEASVFLKHAPADSPRGGL